MNRAEPSSLIRRGVVAVIPRDCRLLVIRRAQGVAAPGAFCFPGGAIEEGESEEQAIVRELDEELGAAIAPLAPLWRSTTPWSVELSWWLARLEADCQLVANPLEVESAYWLSVDEILDLPELLESNRHFLAAWRSGKFAIDGLDDERVP